MKQTYRTYAEEMHIHEAKMEVDCRSRHFIAYTQDKGVTYGNTADKRCISSTGGSERKHTNVLSK